MLLVMPLKSFHRDPQPLGDFMPNFTDLGVYIESPLKRKSHCLAKKHTHTHIALHDLWHSLASCTLHLSLFKGFANSILLLLTPLIISSPLLSHTSRYFMWSFHSVYLQAITQCLLLFFSFAICFYCHYVPVILNNISDKAFHPVSSLRHSHITCKASWFYFFPMQFWLFFFNCFLTVLSSSFLPSLKHSSPGWLCLPLVSTSGFLSVLVVWDHSVCGTAPSSHLYSRDKSLWLLSDVRWCLLGSSTSPWILRTRADVAFHPQSSGLLWPLALSKMYLFSHSPRHKPLIISDILGHDHTIEKSTGPFDST